MTRFVATLFGAWLAACSSDKPAESAYDASANENPPPPASEPVLTPASSDAAGSEARDRRASTDAVPTDPPASTEPAPRPSESTSSNASTATAGAGVRVGETTPGAAPDNTKRNERDKNSGTLTPGDQHENSSDLKITQRIRQAVMADGSLSFTAKNVKIITQNGRVTLRGPVRSPEERASIEAAARNVAGANNVDSQLEIAK
jgi:hyperosmotically inducible periplasmic protein